MRIGQRKHDRFLTDESAFAALGCNYTKVGKIKDISLGGLAFEYITGEHTDQNSSKVDIFLVGNAFNLYNVPCKMVYDIQIHVPHTNNNFVKILTTKRCGIQFGMLTEDDIFHLKLFLEAYTIGLV
jgi:hypothetical protein